MDAATPMLRVYSRCTGETLRKPWKERSSGVPRSPFSRASSAKPCTSDQAANAAPSGSADVRFQTMPQDTPQPLDPIPPQVAD